MSKPYQTHIGSFTRKSTFFWASVGATVGLANLWQFPYLASLHGGGLFVMLYLACLLLVTLPLMVTEAAIGRYSRHGIVLAMDGFIRAVKSSRWWMLAGRLSILAAFLVLSYTAVFGSIALAYMFWGAIGRFSGADQAQVTATLAALVSDPRRYQEFMGWHALFLILVVWVSVKGVVNGLERTLRVVVPGTLVLMLGLFVLALWRGGFEGSSGHILAMHPENLTLDSLKAALFHAFFTLGLGMGVWAIFGSYTAPGTPLKRSILAAVLMDTLVAIVAGLMVYMVATDSGVMGSERGFGLLFVSLPVTLGQMPGNQFVIAALFLLVVMIVWTSSLSLMEPVVGWFREWTGAPRNWTVILVGSGVWLVGLGSLLSLNLWADDRYAGATLFRWLELITGGLLIPVVAILIALFTGWCMTRSLSQRVLGYPPKVFSAIWFWVMRLVLPVVVAFIGMQYTVSSLVDLCETGSNAVWCGQQGAAVQSDDESAGAPIVAPDSEAPAEPASEQEQNSDTSPKTSESTRDKGDSSMGVSEPGPGPQDLQMEDNAPNDADILYHSV